MIMSKLICIDDSIKAGMEEFVAHAYQQWVKKDKPYTIRQLLENEGIVTGVLLNEVRNEPIYQKLLGYVQEPAFRMNRFAEIEENHAEIYMEEAIGELL